MTNTAAKATEWVATLHGDGGTVRIAYRNPAALAAGLAEQTSEGWMVASVYERDRKTYADDSECSVMRSDGKRCGCGGIGANKHVPA